MNEFTVGQVLYYVPESRYNQSKYVTITKVGRIWLSCDGMRISKETLRADGYGYASPGKCWLSKEEYDRYRELCKAWEELKSRIRDRYQPSKDLSVDDIQGVIQLLFYGEKVKELSE